MSAIWTSGDPVSPSVRACSVTTDCFRVFSSGMLKVVLPYLLRPSFVSRSAQAPHFGGVRYLVFGVEVQTTTLKPQTTSARGASGQRQTIESGLGAYYT